MKTAPASTKAETLRNLALDIRSAEIVELIKDTEDRFPTTARLQNKHKKLLIDALEFYADALANERIPM